MNRFLLYFSRSMSAHKTAIKSFDANHATYDVFRPSFGPQLVDQFLVDLKLASGGKFHTEKKILEIASGTGKFTKNLVDHGWGENLEVVEPSEGMLKTFTTNFPQVKSHHGSSYKLPIADLSVDAVIVAQGFHWFSDRASIAEIHRVLKPSGTLGLIWNFDVALPLPHTFSEKQLPVSKYIYSESVPGEVVKANKALEESLEDSPEKPYKVLEDFFARTANWSSKVSKYIYTYDENVPQYRQGKWRQALAENGEFFGPLDTELFLLWQSLIKPEDVFKYWETRSYITDLDDNEKRKIKEKVEKYVEDYATESDKVDLDGEVFLQRPFGTHAVSVSVRK